MGILKYFRDTGASLLNSPLKKHICRLHDILHDIVLLAGLARGLHGAGSTVMLGFFRQCLYRSGVESLNFPQYQFEIQESEGRQVIFDSLRKKWLQLLPEEWVRQHVVQYLVQEKQVPAGLIGVEKGFQFQGMQRRADLIVHDRQGAAVLMVECKAPAVKITQDVFDQVARYNMVIHAGYLFVTNGLQHYCCKIEADTRQYTFLKELPDFSAL